jgi:hypothetical protein
VELYGGPALPFPIIGKKATASLTVAVVAVEVEMVVEAAVEAVAEDVAEVKKNE